MNKRILIPSAIAAILIVGAASYTAVSVEGAHLPAGKPVATAGAAATPTATPTTAKVANPKAGDKVSKDQAMELRKNVDSALRAYELSNGSYIVVDRTQPLPLTVAADLNIQAAAAQRTAGADLNASARVATTIVDKANYETGKQTILCTQMYSGYLNSTGAAGFFWAPALATKSVVNGQLGSKDECVAAANQYVAAQPDPSMWAVLVAG